MATDDDRRAEDPTSGSDDASAPTRTTPPNANDRPAERIGHYRLREKLGEGGMGVVFLAEQEHPVKRRVALKILKAGMDTKAVLARFEAERQALAMMDHANIAKVFDAGETDRGLPYFVMELVKGEPITAYCDRHHLTIRERLELFVPVCHAVQHAHHKGIIHRDLKPSNVLVTASDDRPIPKVIDFGIAKATAALTEHTLFTEQGQLIGTPEYMSPEQAEMTGLDVDTRTDVYSLGVVLYELLTGALPFDPDTLRRAGIARIQEIIRQEEPKKPSTKVSALGEKSTDSARARHTDVARLSRALRGDLDWIVLRAMEKDRTRRYETANGLAMDVGRYLRDEPVFAGPPSAAYRMRKFAKRHRVALAFAAVVVASVSYAAIESNRQRVQAERARDEAQKARDESEAVTDFLSKMLGAVDPGQKGRDVTVREILDEGAKTIGEKFEAQPLVRARLMNTMGGVYRALGHYAEAKSLLEGALAIRESALGSEHLDVASSLNNLGSLLWMMGDQAGSRPLHERALAIREKTRGPDHPDVALSLMNLGNFYWQTGDYAQARPLYERALAIREKALGPDHADVGMSLNSLGNLFLYTGDYATARSMHERALAIREKALGPDHPDVAMSLNNLGNLLWKMGDGAAALPLQERALAIREKTLGPDHPDVAMSLNNLANLHDDAGDYATGRSLHERALAIREKALGPNHPRVGVSLHNLATVLVKLGDHAAARPLLERAIAIQEKTLGPEHPDLAEGLNNLASVYRDSGSPAKARPLFERALTIREKIHGPDHANVAASLEGFAETVRRLGESGKADSLEARAKAIRAKSAATGAPEAASRDTSRDSSRDTSRTAPSR